MENRKGFSLGCSCILSFGIVFMGFLASWAIFLSVKPSLLVFYYRSLYIFTFLKISRPMKQCLRLSELMLKINLANLM